MRLFKLRIASPNNRASEMAPRSVRRGFLAGDLVLSSHLVYVILMNQNSGGEMLDLYAEAVWRFAGFLHFELAL